MEGVQRWATSRQTTLRMLAYDGVGPGGPSVVVLHGLGTGVDVLREAVPGLDPFARLAEQGLNVLALDWPGHGRSGGRRGRLTYRLAMDAAATAVDEARSLWEGPVGLFGTAMGGVLAFYATLEDPDVGAVVCHDVLDLREARTAMQRARQRLFLPVAALAARRVPRERLERVRVPLRMVVAATDTAADPALAQLLRAHPQAVSSYDVDSLVSILARPEDKPDIAAQRAPVLIAVGGQDRVLPEVPARVFASRVPGAQLWVLPGGSHQLLLEHHRALVPVVSRFLTERLAAG